MSAEECAVCCLEMDQRHQGLHRRMYWRWRRAGGYWQNMIFWYCSWLTKVSGKCMILDMNVAVYSSLFEHKPHKDSSLHNINRILPTFPLYFQIYIAQWDIATWYRFNKSGLLQTFKSKRCLFLFLVWQKYQKNTYKKNVPNVTSDQAKQVLSWLLRL